MLFSPPNALDKNFPYVLIGITCLLHVMLLTVFFIIEGYFSGEKPLIFDLKNMGSRVSMLSQPRKRTSARKRPVKKRAPAKKVQPKKKAPVKKAVAKKQPIKKVIPKKVVAKKTIPIKKKVVAKPVKKAPVKKQVKAKPAKAEPVKTVPAKAVGPKEFNVADAALSSDKVIREIYRHLTIPPGIEDVAEFTMTFDVNDKGKVINLKSRGSEPLVVYTAFKDALLRCTMPIKNRKNIPLVIK